MNSFNLNVFFFPWSICWCSYFVPTVVLTSTERQRIYKFSTAGYTSINTSLSIAVRAEKLFHWHSLTVQTAGDSVCFVPLCSLSPVSPPLSCWCYPSALAPLGAHGWLWLTAWHSCQATVAMWLLADEECSRGIAAGLLSASDDQRWLERRRAHQTVTFKNHRLLAFQFSACVKLHGRHYEADSYKLRSVFIPCGLDPNPLMNS